MTTKNLPILRWGIIGAGMVSSGFAMDLCLERDDLHTRHIVQAVGSSSIEKAKSFVAQRCPSQKPNLYDTYQGVYDDPDVDAVYIGTPHTLHLRNVLDAIAAGKHVLCEKPFAMNAKEAQIIFDAAEKKGVFVMEAVWCQFFPITKKLRSLLHEEKVIGDIKTVFADFGAYLPFNERHPNPGPLDKWQGVGSLIDIGVYCMNWASIGLDEATNRDPDVQPTLTASMIFHNEDDPDNKFEEGAAVILKYPDLNAQAVVTSSYLYSSEEEFAHFMGSKGSISLSGSSSSMPNVLTIRIKGEEEQRLEFNRPGWGFQYEADAVAQDLRASRSQNEICSWDHTLRILKRIDAARAQCGLVFPQDKE